MSLPTLERTETTEQDFSLVLGGPLFQALRKSRLEGGAGELLLRRLMVIVGIVWLPLFGLCAVTDFHHAVESFFRDIETQVRFLVALPALIVAEVIVNARLMPAVKAFTKRKLIIPEELPRFHAAVDSAMRLRNSIPLEIGLIVLVYTIGQLTWWKHILVGSTWFATAADGHMTLTPAGYWNVFFSVPAFQFILLRWYLRLLIWFRFLWQVSRLKLHLVATHPDRAGGLSFLGRISYAFGPILFAQGAMLSAMIATRVLYGGEKLMSYKLDAIGLIAFFLAVIFGPLMVFSPQLAQAKRKGLAQYGTLANEYVTEFEKKWVLEAPSHHDEMLGSGDFQSLADMGNSYEVVKEMRAIPFGVQDMVRLAYATAIPLLPLGLTMFSLDELVTQLLKTVF